MLGLIKGRHELPVSEYIFEGEIENVFDFDSMQETLCTKIGYARNLEVIVTGLTVVTVELIKYCNSNKIDLTLYHFDRSTNEYVPQFVPYGGGNYEC